VHGEWRVPNGPVAHSRSAQRRRCMSRLSLFNSPLLLGFDHFERALDRVSKISSDGYPPYNIEQLGENSLRITLAVAGFTMGDLSITIEDNQLVVRGKQTDDAERVYLHRGIAARQFQRSFVLAEGIEVSGAWLDNGLLHIDLVRPEVESRVRTVDIRSGKTGVKTAAESSQN
jgi:HSP20 family molecular chaperone IbpA